MLSAQDSQFKITEEGQIFYQENPTNPLPGQLISYVAAGDSILAPRVVLFESDLVKPDDKVAVRAHVQGWLERYIAAVLEPLVGLADQSDLKGTAKGIAFQVHEALGIVPREQIEDLIVSLDQDDRRALRAKKVRLGPVLVFIPALNKPAAVRLRGLLWGLFNNKTLPMACPKDGIVSFVVDPQAVDRKFYQSVGYPVFGTRAIRIDMLDRVISAIYDSAKDGQFQAQHQMAEWLGCTIDGLYEVLEAMGHRRIVEAAPVVVEEAPKAPAEEAVVEAPAEAPVVQAKPALATFRLKKGKAFEKQAAAKKIFTNDKPAKSSEVAERKTKKTFKPRGEKPAPREMPKIMQAGPAPKLEDSPFAILGQLKKKSDG
jgi:ATP-dependent RNA helicase SUPV3L1/SUV3